MLSEEEIRQIADGTGFTYHFDFSKISGDKYEPLLRTLQHFAKKQIESLGFSCDELYRAEQKSLAGQQIPVQVLNSIAKTKSHYVRNIVELLCLVLPRSNRIKEITLSNLNIKKDYLARIIAAMSHSPSLENINLKKIPIGDEIFRVLLQVLDPNQIKSINISFCAITNNCTDDIISFIHKKDQRITKNGGITHFTISKTEIDENGQKRILEALGIEDQQSSNNDEINEYYNRIRSRGQNENISSLTNVNEDNKSDDKNLQTQVPSEHLPKLEKPNQYISQNSNKEKKQITLIDKKIKEKVIQRKEEDKQLKDLQKKNSELIQTLNQMRSSLHAVQYDEETYIIGKGAEQFIEFIHSLEAKIKMLEERKIANGGKL